jgi:triphosphoribosyl-dephospho-CoA synthase
MTPLQQIALSAQTACIWEVLSRKVGNVHPKASFEKTSYLDFLLSASAIGTAFCDPTTTSLGELILKSVQATQVSVRQNTNLGIILLLAPLARAGTPDSVETVLQQTTVTDTKLVYQAIREANPGGLGKAPREDVQAEPTVMLREAMALASERDLIARQYANGFQDVLRFGLPALQQGLERFGCVEAAVIHCQLQWLSGFPDSLIARKNGPQLAEEVQKRAKEVLNQGGLETPGGRQAGLQFDRYLRSDGNRLNPGTTADLVTACLFVMLLQSKLATTTPFHWPVSDWL